jgi:hypothetical protein
MAHSSPAAAALSLSLSATRPLLSARHAHYLGDTKLYMVDLDLAVYALAELAAVGHEAAPGARRELGGR